MGLLEAIVVIYLRQVYYPQGFDFPLAEMSSHMASIELLREAATLVMLASIGMLAGKTWMQRFAWFLFSFAVWDLVYYLGLKWLIGWPSSFLTWDILFLIPVVWVGPVLAPVICSLTMIGLAFCILHADRAGLKPVMNRWEWMLIGLGAFVIFTSFIWDYSALLLHHLLTEGSSPVTDMILRNILKSYVPTHFLWGLFMAGEVLILAGIGFLIKRNQGRKF